MARFNHHILVLSAILFLIGCSKGDDQDLSNQKEINSFVFESLTPPVVADIDRVNNKITINLPTNVTTTNLRPTIEVSDKATITPESGTSLDFSTPQTYIVTAENGSSVVYETVLNRLPSNEKSILSFHLEGRLNKMILTEINQEDSEIVINLPPGTDPTNLSPTIEVSENATINPPSQTHLDFSIPQTYIVTAEDGTTNVYTSTLKIRDESTDEIPTPPKHLCIFYAWPSTVNGSNGNIDLAVSVFQKYDILVFGDGLWKSQHGDNQKTREIIKRLKEIKPSISIFGYVDVGVSTQNLSEQELRNHIDGWKSMEVTGVFGDDFGFDFGVTRQRQNIFIDHAHNQGLSVFANGFRIEDVLGGEDCHLNGDYNDYYLIESFFVSDGQYTGLSSNIDKADRAYFYSKTKGVKIATVVREVPGNLNDSFHLEDKFRLSWYGTALYNFEAFQYTDITFSANNSPLYFFQNLENSLGDSWIDTDWVQEISSSKYQRRTNTMTIFIEGDGSSSGTGGTN